MSRNPHFFAIPNDPFPLFSIFSFPSCMIDFVAFAHDLFLKNALAVALIDELRQKNINVSVSFASDSEIFSFGFFSGSHISIRHSLNHFEKTMVLLFEICNICNNELMHCVFYPEAFNDAKTYVEVSERAEFLSLHKAAQIYQSGFEQKLWPDFSQESLQMRDFGLLLHMNCEEYLEWAQTPRKELNGASHASHYEQKFKEATTTRIPEP